MLYSFAHSVLIFALLLAACGPQGSRSGPDPGAILVQEARVAALSLELDRLEALREVERALGEPAVVVEGPSAQDLSAKDRSAIEAEAEQAHVEAKRVTALKLAEVDRSESEAVAASQASGSSLDEVQKKVDALEFRVEQFQGLGFVSDELLSARAALTQETQLLYSAERLQAEAQQELKAQSIAARSEIQAQAVQERVRIDQEVARRLEFQESVYDKNLESTVTLATAKDPRVEELYLSTQEQYRDAVWLLYSMQGR
jgi:hypothetical protein